MEKKAKPTETTMVVHETQEVSSVESFISAAIANNAPVETMEKLFALHEKVKAGKAKEAFIDAMSKFQSECPIIAKNKNVMNKDGKTVRYSYATLDSIVSQVKPILGKYGLSYTTTLENKPGFVVATCKVTHIMGHSEVSSFEIPIDTEGFMTAPQKYASAQTFAKRYAFCNALGILTGEDDFDATDVEKKPEVDGIMSIKGKITFLLKELDIDTNTADIPAEIKKLTKLAPKDDASVLGEIKNRLEVLVEEARAAKA